MCQYKLPLTGIQIFCKSAILLKELGQKLMVKHLLKTTIMFAIVVAIIMLINKNIFTDLKLVTHVINILVYYK